MLCGFMLLVKQAINNFNILYCVIDSECKNQLFHAYLLKSIVLH
jgi:hypothetical protein